MYDAEGDRGEGGQRGFRFIIFMAALILGDKKAA